MIAMFVIKLVYGILTGAGVVIGRRYVDSWLISVYKKREPPCFEPHPIC